MVREIGYLKRLDRFIVNVVKASRRVEDCGPLLPPSRSRGPANSGTDGECEPRARRRPDRGHEPRHVGSIAAAPSTFEPNSTAVSWKTIEQGAATSVLLAASPLVEGITGRYFEGRNEAEPHRPGVRRGVAAHAIDPDRTARLWQVSLDAVKSARAAMTAKPPEEGHG